MFRNTCPVGKLLEIAPIMSSNLGKLQGADTELQHVNLPGLKLPAIPHKSGMTCREPPSGGNYRQHNPSEDGGGLQGSVQGDGEVCILKIPSAVGDKCQVRTVQLQSPVPANYQGIVRLHPPVPANYPLRFEGLGEHVMPHALTDDEARR